MTVKGSAMGERVGGARMGIRKTRTNRTAGSPKLSGQEDKERSAAGSERNVPECPVSCLLCAFTDVRCVR